MGRLTLTPSPSGLPFVRLSIRPPYPSFRFRHPQREVREDLDRIQQGAQLPLVTSEVQLPLLPLLREAIASIRRDRLLGLHPGAGRKRLVCLEEEAYAGETGTAGMASQVRCWVGNTCFALRWFLIPPVHSNLATLGCPLLLERG